MKASKANSGSTDTLLNIFCLLVSLNSVTRILRIFNSSSPEKSQLVSNYVWYFPYLVAFYVIQIISYYFIWKRKKIGLYLYIINVIITLPINLITGSLGNISIPVILFLYIGGSISMILIGKRIAHRFS